MNELRTVFLGNDPWSAIALEASMTSEEPIVPVAVFTRLPKPAGRGSSLRPTAVADAARRLDLPLVEVATLRDDHGPEVLRASRPDVLVVVAYGELLPPEVLDVPRLGGVNLHLSLLPRWRGASPVQRTIQAGDTVTGVTIIALDEGLDTGPMLARAEVTVDPAEDAGSLGARLAGIGGSLLTQAIRALHEGTVAPKAQSTDDVTYAPKLTSGDRAVRWTDPAMTIDRRVRAVSPTPGATTTFRNDVLKIIRGRPVAGDGAPGAIIGVDDDSGGVDIGTADGAYRLLEVAPAGKKHMPADAWARGARFVPGERLAPHPTEDA